MSPASERGKVKRETSHERRKMRGKKRSMERDRERKRGLRRRALQPQGDRSPAATGGKGREERKRNKEKE